MSDQQVWFITGASRGMGVDIAKAALAAGHSVVATARNADAVTAALSDDDHVLAAKVDVTDSAEAQAAVQAAIDRFGRIDVLVNNAGFATFGPFAENNIDEEIEEVRLNVEALTDLTKRLLPDILAAKGKILNLGSTASFQPGPKMAVYYATKAYVLSFSEALWYELRPRGVTVTCLCPGPTRTGFQSRAGQEGLRLLNVGLVSTDASAVARAGVDGLFRGKRVVVPGFMNLVGTWAGHFSPTRLTLAVIDWLHGKQR